MFKAAASPIEHSPLDLFVVSLQTVSQGAALPKGLEEHVSKVLCEAKRLLEVSSDIQAMPLNEYGTEAIYLASMTGREVLSQWAKQTETKVISRELATTILHDLAQL